MNEQLPTKRCPFCAEEILAAAQKCKHCGSNLGDAPRNAAVVPPPMIQERADTPKPKSNGCWIVAIVVAVVAFVPVVAILAAIALPQYRNYTQRSSNAACMAEAKAFMGTAVPEMKNEQNSTPFSPVACSAMQPGGPLTPADYEKGITVVFTPWHKGNAALFRRTVCNAGSAICTFEENAPY